MSDKDQFIVSGIQKEMESSYLAYAMSVITSRAIPDVRDGLKPVHRRILFAMNEIGCQYNRPYKKVARIVGDVMGKYHPHGDSSISDALVRMGQDFSMGCMLIDGQGNFGSLDGDPPAAMRYIEARLSKITSLMFNEIDQGTVDFKPNYDGSENEPSVLPTPFPNILVNGSEGIAVGMATNIPTHNLSETIAATIATIDNPEISEEELLQIVPAPDFPTGGIIINKSVANRAILTGRGSVKIRGRASIEEGKGDRDVIIITEIPYQVNKATMITKIAELVKEKRIEGISNIRDESSQEGIRVIIELKRGVQGDIILNQLYQYSPLQSSFPVNMLALNKGRPELMNFLSIIKNFIEFRVDVVRKRVIFLLNQAREKAHLLIGFYVAVDSIDKVIQMIRSSKNTEEARAKLLAEFWPVNSTIEKLINLVCDRENKIKDGKFKFTDKQVKAILEMRLSRLTGMERESIIQNIESISLEIMDFLSILGDNNRIKEIIKSELEQIKEEYGVPRKTEIQELEDDSNIEDLIPREDILISLTNNGYIKRAKLSNYTSQNRGGKGKIGMATFEDDIVNKILSCTTHDNLLLFTKKGLVFKIKCYKIPESNLNSKGRSVVNLLNLEDGDTVENILSISSEDYQKDINIIFATKNGNVRRSSIADFLNINSKGKIAIDLDDNDALIGVEIANNDENVFLASRLGMAIRFKVDDLRIIKSRKSDGVRGMTLDKGDEVRSLCILKDNENQMEIRSLYKKIDLEFRLNVAADKIGELEIIAELEKYKESGINFTIEHFKKLAKEEQILITITSTGLGKRTSAYDYRITGRGGKGITNVNLDKNFVVGTKIVEPESEIILMSKSGKAIRIAVSDVSVISRNTKGVKIFNTEEEVISFSVC